MVSFLKDLTKKEYTIQQRCEMIDNTRWANDFNWSEINSLAKNMFVYTAKKGMVICQEGKIEPYMCLIIQGKVKILKEDFGNQKKAIISLGQGDHIGEMALIDGSPRSASAIADEDSLLLVLTQDKFFSLIEETPRLGVKLLLKITKSMSQRLRLTSGVLVDYLEE